MMDAERNECSYDSHAKRQMENVSNTWRDVWRQHKSSSFKLEWESMSPLLTIFFFFFFPVRYNGKILIMERIVYFYMIEKCLMVKGKFWN